jgi:hypothetical protein
MTAFHELSSEGGPSSIRSRFQAALAGKPVAWPVYAVYDWFVLHRPIDWSVLFAQGLGQINHACVLQETHPHLEIVETTEPTPRGLRRDVRWITDHGELHEWYLGEWRQEYLIKTPADYSILRRALEDTQYVATSEAYHRSQAALGASGITLGQLSRTPLMELQIDYAGLARFSMDLVDEMPALMELLECMEELFVTQCREAVKTSPTYIKLWENLSLETLGPAQYRRRLVPLYHKVFDIFSPAGKRLLVHYDGKLRHIAAEIAALDFDGIDSFTPPPEGDMGVADARQVWPDKFLWLHPSLGWYREPSDVMRERIRGMVRDAAGTRFCLMISEDVPPNWQETVPMVLQSLRE